MSGPQRQQLADVQTVTPALTDKAVTIQAGKVKTSLYSAIYNLFKTGYDAVYATSTNVTSEIAAALVGYATQAYVILGNAATLSSANSYTDAQVGTKLNKFNTANNNNDSGNVYSGTLNGETGTILFTGNINANDYAVFTVGNNSCTTSSRITDLYIITTITGYDISIMNYTPISNEFRVCIKNNSGAPIAGFRLSFRVNN